MSRKKGILNDIIMYGIMLLIIGGAVYYFLGDKINQHVALKDVTIQYEMETKANYELSVRKVINKSDLWLSYYKDKSPEFKITVDFKRKKPSKNEMRTSENSKTISPGHLITFIKIYDRKLKKRIYQETYKRTLNSFILKELGDTVSNKRLTKCFVDEEKKVIKHYLPSYMNVACMNIMRRVKEKKMYAVIIAQHLDSKEKVESDAAARALCKIKNKNSKVIQITKKASNSQLKHVAENSKKVLKCLK
ncbi:MAG: hypothetical protein HRT89_12205 [Lentisphaeria bacterium]|nr:hypothetical protein [Lentisphaeria bacterium]